jgi:hypothetical protein
MKQNRSVTESLHCFLLLLLVLQLSARAAYGAELRRQIDEKDREKRMKKDSGQPPQSRSNHSVEHGVYSRNRYEFERARVAGGSFGFGVDALQRPVASGSVLPPLNMDPAHSNADNIWNRPAVQRQQQPDFRAKNEITAPGKSMRILRIRRMCRLVLGRAAL